MIPLVYYSNSGMFDQFFKNGLLEYNSVINENEILLKELKLLAHKKKKTSKYNQLLFTYQLFNLEKNYFSSL